MIASSLMSRSSLLRALSLAALAVGTLSLTACGDAPAEGECQKLLTHFIGLEVKAADEADRAKFTESLQQDIGKGFLERCERNIKASQISCSLKASTKAEFEACDS